MTKTPLKAVLDTNILISSILFGGKPRQIIKLVQENKIIAITTSALMAELIEVLVKKFQFTTDKIILVEELIKENFTVVYPSETLHITSDEDDNRVLEAAIEGKCSYIVTGDNDLLQLIAFKHIRIATPNTFLSNMLIDHTPRT